MISQPNFLGQLEDVDALTRWVHENGLLVIAAVNPTSLALLKSPGQWGDSGADIVCGDGQPLGVVVNWETTICKREKGSNLPITYFSKLTDWFSECYKMRNE